MEDIGTYADTLGFEEECHLDLFRAVMNLDKRRGFKRVAAAAAALVLVAGSGRAVYAMDIGGIQRIVQVWVHGDQTDAVFTVNDGAYSLDYKDTDGNNVHQVGGGVAFNSDGTERSLTEEELVSEINAPDVSYEEDGRVIVYYLNQELDITGKFEDGVCYVQLQADGETTYMTIKYQDGYAASPHGYIEPETFN